MDLSTLKSMMTNFLIWKALEVLVVLAAQEVLDLALAKIKKEEASSLESLWFGLQFHWYGWMRGEMSKLTKSSKKPEKLLEELTLNNQFQITTGSLFTHLRELPVNSQPLTHSLEWSNQTPWKWRERWKSSSISKNQRKGMTGQFTLTHKLGLMMLSTWTTSTIEMNALVSKTQQSGHVRQRPSTTHKLTLGSTWCLRASSNFGMTGKLKT